MWAQYLRERVDRTPPSRPQEIAAWVRTLPTWTWWVAAGLFALQGYSLWYDKIYQKKLAARNAAKAANRLKTTVAIFNRDLAKDIIKAGGMEVLYATAGDLDVDGHEMRRRLCQLMLNDMRIYLGDINGDYLEVTLLIYSAADGSKMRVECRGDGNGRGTHKRDEWVESGGLFAHVSIFRRGISVINDFRKQKWFDFRSVTRPDQNPPYRSMLTVPLHGTNPSASSKTQILGVITVDSAKPYHFAGHEKEIADVLMPHIELIKPFVQASFDSVEIETRDLR